MKTLHELSVTSSMVELILTEIKKRDIKKVFKVNLLIGDLSCIEEDSVRYYFDLLSKDTPLEETELSIEYKKSSFRCLDCGSLYERCDFDFRCPYCGGSGRIKSANTFFYIESIEVEK